jgi:hypothetical protein
MCIDQFVLSAFLAKMTFWGLFFLSKYETFLFGRLLSPLSEAAQMTQNKKKKTLILSVQGGLKAILTFASTPL